MKKFAEDLLDKLEQRPKVEKKFKIKIDIKQIRLPKQGELKLPKVQVPKFDNIKLPKAPDLIKIKFTKKQNGNSAKKLIKIKLPELKFGKKKSENGKNNASKQALDGNASKKQEAAAEVVEQK